MSKERVFPISLDRELNSKYRCVRCGKWYVEIDNIGQLRCRQQYFIGGRMWSVAADHMQMCSEDEHWRDPVGQDQLKRSWICYVYADSADDIIDIDSRYARLLKPVDARCIIRDTRHVADVDKRDDQSIGVLTLGEHVQRAWIAKTDSAPSNALMLGIAEALDDSESDSESDYSESEEDERHEPTRSLRIVRYDLPAYEHLRTQIWPKVIEYNMAKRKCGSLRSIPIHETPAWNDMRTIARIYGIGHEDWLKNASPSEWKYVQ